MTIHFGTDGWRGVISDTFTFHNLRLVSQAIADAVASEEWLNGGAAGGKQPDRRRMVVGFDTRFLSDRYAVEAARVLAANGYQVFLTTADVPTPTLSHAVKNLGAVAGIMITASHNAPRYSGVKLKSMYGGSALPEQCRRVEVYLNDNEARGRGPNLMDFEQARSTGLLERINPTQAYYEHLRTLINFEVHRRRAFTPGGRLDVRFRSRSDQRHPARDRLRGSRGPLGDEPGLRRDPPRAHRTLPWRIGRRYCRRTRPAWVGDGRRW